jgi:N-acetylglucosamine kinase-like BadF-type ATPase
MTGAAVVGVDVGGSGLRLQVTYAGVPGRVRTSTGVRIGSTGIDVAAAVADARTLLEAELDGPGSSAVDAGRDAERGAEPVVVVWSMRGLLFLTDRAAVMQQVREGLGGAATVVVSDAVANLIGAVGDLRPGAVVAAGSGAVAFGSDFGEVWHRVDGWGHVLGDVGSGAWLGLEGLRAALRADDALAGGSQRLLGAAVERFGPTPTWPRQLMAAPDAPEQLASFAPVVSAAAEPLPAGAGEPAAANPVAPDPVAADICRRAGRGLAEALLAAAAGLAQPTLVASGGVLAAPAVRAALVDSLNESGRELSPAHGGALDGTLILGRRLVEAGSLPEHPAYLLVANP